jgi:hypothetical protein
MTYNSWVGAIAAALVLGVALPAAAAPEHLETISRVCSARLKMTAAGCECIANKAATELNDLQQTFVAAIVTKNDAEATSARNAMTNEELTEAGTFVTSAPRQCAAG